VVQKKIEMRRRILADLKSVAPETAAAKSLKLQSRLKSQLQNEDGLWAGFQSMPHTEPQIRWTEVSEKIQWCFPVIDDQKLKFKKLVQAFQKSPLGFNEPTDGEDIQVSQLKGVVIPGLAFDPKGHRLGRGRGFYDQTLENFKGTMIGVCYQQSLVDEIPTEDHDLKCQFIITDEKSVAVTANK